VCVCVCVSKMEGGSERVWAREGENEGQHDTV